MFAHAVGRVEVPDASRGNRVRCAFFADATIDDGTAYTNTITRMQRTGSAQRHPDDAFGRAVARFVVHMDPVIGHGLLAGQGSPF